MRAAGLFAGIGGVELGLAAAGIETALLCEIEPGAQAVLRAHFAGVPIVDDVRNIERLPGVELIAAGFPCQDLSQAGRTAGITGHNSGLVGEVFRLVRSASPEWLLLENVPFMLQLDRGEAMRFLVQSIEHLGYSWAYRVVDTRSFGLPQRRRRVIFVASKTHDPRAVLFADDAGENEVIRAANTPCGFYWTEGLRGVGWAVDAVPTLKGGSGLGIPSPPAIWFPKDNVIGLPDLRDAERLQGFEVGWTSPAASAVPRGENHRWKLIGNAISVPVAAWVAGRITKPGTPLDVQYKALAHLARFPLAACGGPGQPTESVSVSTFPKASQWNGIGEFLNYPVRPISRRAAAGFLERARRSTSLNYGDKVELLECLDAIATSCEPAAA